MVRAMWCSQNKKCVLNVCSKRDIHTYTHTHIHEKTHNHAPIRYSSNISISAYCSIRRTYILYNVQNRT